MSAALFLAIAFVLFGIVLIVVQVRLAKLREDVDVLMLEASPEAPMASRPFMFFPDEHCATVKPNDGDST